MTPEPYSIKYPRNRITRGIVRGIGRLLMRVFARVSITGQEHFPPNGPLILVGNHVAIIEVLMMALYVPYLAEILATGDIPIDPRFRWLTERWGVIPVNRGNVNRNEMRLPLDVLKQGGVIGIFPEGGIWEGDSKQARTGVAWLSYHSQAPILPIGFGGMRGALRAMLQFKRPRLVMNVGQLMPPVQGKVEGLSRKEALEAGANAVMEAINALVPESDRRDTPQIIHEQFDFEITRHVNGGLVPTADDVLTAAQRQALGMFFHRPVILDVMARNMNLPVQPLQALHLTHNPQEIAAALAVVQGFFAEHPHFLSYRFGYAASEAMLSGLTALQSLMQASATAGEVVRLTPVRTFEDAQTGETITQTLQGFHGDY